MKSAQNPVSNEGIHVHIHWNDCSMKTKLITHALESGLENAHKYKMPKHCRSCELGSLNTSNTGNKRSGDTFSLYIPTEGKKKELKRGKVL